MSTNTIRERIADDADLRARIRGHGSPDPGVVAEDILADDLTYDELYVIARAGMRELARGVLTGNHARHATGTGRTGRSGTEGVPPGTNPSPRMRRLIDHYEQALAETLYAADDEWKFLADCTSGNLRYAAKGRREKSDRLLARADRYDRLADALDQHGVATVAELPREIGEPLVLGD